MAIARLYIFIKNKLGENNMKQGIVGTKISMKKIILSKEFLFIISILFSSYELFGISLTYILLGVYVFYIWFIKGKRFVLLDRSFCFFMIILFIHEIIMIFIHLNDSKTIINNIIGAIIAIIIIGIFSVDINLEKLKKAYYLIAIIVSIGLLYHAVLVYGLGKAVTPIQLIPRLISQSTLQWEHSLMRPMSCFIEPQAYATFMIPAIFFLLNNKKIFWAVAGTICVFLSTSSLGIFMCSIMWLISLVDSNFSLQMKIKIIFSAVIFLVFILNSNIFQFAFNKIENIDTSSDARLSQGFIIYRQMPIQDQILGVGKKSLIDYILNNNINVPRMRYATDVGKWSYVTTIAGIMIYYGLAGLSSFAVFVFGQLKKKNFLIKEFIILLFILSFGQSILFNVYFIMYYTLLFCLDNNKTKYIIFKF